MIVLNIVNISHCLTQETFQSTSHVWLHTRRTYNSTSTCTCTCTTSIIPTVWPNCKSYKPLQV